MKIVHTVHCVVYSALYITKHNIVHFVFVLECGAVQCSRSLQNGRLTPGWLGFDTLLINYCHLLNSTWLLTLKLTHLNLDSTKIWPQSNTKIEAQFGGEKLGWIWTRVKCNCWPDARLQVGHHSWKMKVSSWKFQVKFETFKLASHRKLILVYQHDFNMTDSMANWTWSKHLMFKYWHNGQEKTLCSLGGPYGPVNQDSVVHRLSGSIWGELGI